jgi:glutamate racemase
VRLIDSAEETALQTESVLKKTGLSAASDNRGRRDFYASDAPERFQRLARHMLGYAVARVRLHSFDL